MHCQLLKVFHSFELISLTVSVSVLCVLSHQMQFIDALDGEDLLLTGEVKWRPLLEENAQSILKVTTPTYNDTGL